MSGVSTGATLKEEGQWGGACPLERGTAGTSGVGDRNVLSLDLTGYMGVPACKDSSSYTFRIRILFSLCTALQWKVNKVKNPTNRDFPAVQWFGLHAFTAEGMGWLPGRETKILQALGDGQKEKIVQ